jgi:hypothetical protein
MEQVPLLGSLFHKTTERLLQLWVVCTLAMLDQVYSNNSMLLRFTFLTDVTSFFCDTSVCKIRCKPLSW